MPRGVYAAASAMIIESRALDVVAQNLANANSPGYRRQVALRADFVKTLADAGSTGGVGIHDNTSGRIFTQGVMDETQSDLDLAISGQGFFRVRDPQGQTWLTRNGHFSLAGDGRVVDDHGWALEGQGGPLVVPPEAERLVVDARGLAYAQITDDKGAPAQLFLDQLRVVEVADLSQLQARDGQRFHAPDGAQTDITTATSIRQGFVEQANVDPVGELVTMISIQRRYDAAQRALRTNDETGRGFSDLLRGA